jgi:cytochrome c biogenesis protein CcmG/thiol:disulfide interchange protein DsbE
MKRRRRTALWSALGVGVLAVCLVAVLATRPAGENTLVASPLVGRQAPQVAGTALGGTKVSLAALRGRFVLVNFFASWCPPCQEEAPQLAEFAAAQRGPTGAAVVGVVFSDSAGNAAGFARDYGVTWPIVTDPGGRIALAYGVPDPPESFLVAPDGRVAAAIVGGVTAAGLQQLIDESEASSA